MKPNSIVEVRTNHERITAGTSVTGCHLMDRIEETSLSTFHGSAESLFAVEGHPVRDDIRQAVALFLHRHPDLLMPLEFVAHYLHCTEEQAKDYVEKGEIVLVSGASSATGADMLVVCRYLGVMASQLMRVAA